MRKTLFLIFKLSSFELILFCCNNVVGPMNVEKCFLLKLEINFDVLILGDVTKVFERSVGATEGQKIGVLFIQIETVLVFEYSD